MTAPTSVYPLTLDDILPTARERGRLDRQDPDPQRRDAPEYRIGSNKATQVVTALQMEHETGRRHRTGRRARRGAQGDRVGRPVGRSARP